METALVTSIRVENYRSIANCQVDLQPLTFVLGRNGAGKSNFVDVFRFVADALKNNLDYALNRRGGINELRRRSKTRPNEVEIELKIALANGARATYGFHLAGAAESAEDDHTVKREWCRIDGLGSRHGFLVEKGAVSELANPPAATEGRLYLVNVSGLPQFKPLFDHLASMQVYNLSPHQMKKLVSVDSRMGLTQDGANIASVWERLGPDQRARIQQYMQVVLPAFESVSRLLVASKETLEFTQRIGDTKVKFPAEQMSDGTVRALGIMVAALQDRKVALVGIEEPETALHPAAAGALLDCLMDGAERRQVLVTSQSPDLLDSTAVRENQVLAARWIEGQSSIAPLDAAGARMMREHLATAGELLRQDALDPELPALSNPK